MVQDGKVLTNKRCDNTLQAILKAIKALQKQLKGLKLANTLFCLAHIGIYAYPLLHAFKQEEASIWLAQAIQIQRSLGYSVVKVILSMPEELPFTLIKIGKWPVCGCPEERR